MDPEVQAEIRQLRERVDALRTDLLSRSDPSPRARTLREPHWAVKVGISSALIFTFVGLLFIHLILPTMIDGVTVKILGAHSTVDEAQKRMDLRLKWLDDAITNSSNALADSNQRRAESHATLEAQYAQLADEVNVWMNAFQAMEGGDSDLMDRYKSSLQAYIDYRKASPQGGDIDGRFVNLNSLIAALSKQVNGVRQDLQPESGFTRDENGHPYPEVSLSGNGRVCLSGLLRNSGIQLTKEHVLVKLPEGMRPVKQHVFVVEAAGGSIRVDVCANGEVRAEDGRVNCKWISLDGICFNVKP